MNHSGNRTAIAQLPVPGLFVIVRIEVDGSDTDEEADLLNFDDLNSDEFV